MVYLRYGDFIKKMEKSSDKKVKTNELTYEPQEHEFKYIKHARDNRSNQLNPNNPKYHKSRNNKKKSLV